LQPAELFDCAAKAAWLALTFVIPRQHFRLLCVDDDAPILDVLKDAFSMSGYDVETALNGFVALQKVNRNPHHFQLILTDLRMPGLDGFGFIEQARSSGYTGPFVVYAGMISDNDRQRLRELRVSRVIAKPARAGELIATIREVQAGF
jgi:DNA-binding response OmpR family regulator